MTKACLLAMIWLLGSACSNAPRDATGDSVPVVDTPDAAIAIDSSRLIHSDGIGIVGRGMTIGALRAALPPAMSLGAPAPFMVDIDALAVMRGVDSLYYVLVASGEPADDGTLITLVATDDTTFRTAQGVGPGVTISDAARIYGHATLSYNTSDESREYVTFANHTDSSIVFRATPSLEGVLAGVYSTNGEYNTTSAYEPHAMIGLVMVRLER